MGKDRILDIMDQAQILMNFLMRIVVLVWVVLSTSCTTFPKIIVPHDPLTPKEHINLGLAYQKNGEINHAIDEFKTAAKKLPDAYVYLGNLYFKKNDTDKAEKFYRKAINGNSDLGDAYNNLAWLYYTKRENLDEAQSLAQKAVDINPDNPTYQDTLKKINKLRTLP